MPFLRGILQIVLACYAESFKNLSLAFQDPVVYQKKSTGELQYH